MEIDNRNQVDCVNNYIDEDDEDSDDDDDDVDCDNEDDNDDDDEGDDDGDDYDGDDDGDDDSNDSVMMMANHVPHPSNDQKMSKTIRFRLVLTMVLDWVQFLDFLNLGLSPNLYIFANSIAQNIFWMLFWMGVGSEI